MDAVPNNKQQSSLQTLFLEIRKQILRSISLNLPKGSLALGPVLFFIEDCEQRCLYNWSNVTWEELKLGNLLKGVLRDIKDVSNYCSKNIPHELAKKTFVDIHTECKEFLNVEIDEDFDNWPVFINKYSQFEKFIDTCEHSFIHIPKISIEAIERLDISQIDVERLPHVLREIYEINEGRFFALDELKLAISGSDDEQFNLIGTFISKHPKYNDISSGANKAINRWNQFREKIKTFDKTNLERANKNYENLMNTAIEIFCDLPQEVPSSDSLAELRKINTEMHLKRSDKTAIRLSDLVYHPLQATYEIKELKEKYKLYYITHFFERLFYIVSKQTTKTSLIKNIIILPIKFFDAQVIGQIIIISPEPIPRQLVINSIEAFLPKIREAATMDFETRIFSHAVNDSKITPKEILDETKYLFANLKMLLAYNAMALLKYNHGTNSWALLKKTPIDVTVNDNKFVSWVGKKIIEIGENKCFVFSINEREMKSLFGVKGEPESCFIGMLESTWDKHAVVLFFSEHVDLMRSSASEIYLSITRVLEKISLVKERQLVDSDKIAIVHNASKELGKIKVKLVDLRENLKNDLMNSEHVKRALFLLNNYLSEVDAITRNNFNEYKDQEYEYDLAAQIGSLVESIIHESPYIRNYYKLMSLQKTRAKIIDIKSGVGEAIYVTLNKRALYFLLDNLIKNAIDHSNWIFLKTLPDLPPLVVIECEKKDNFAIIKIANIPDNDNLKFNSSEVFYSPLATPHLRLIGAIFEVASRSKDICYKEYIYDNFTYVCVELKITL